MYRREKFLDPLEANTIPREFLFFDTETHINDNGNGITDLPFRLGAAVKITLDNELRPMKRHIHRFNSTLEFYDLIEQYNRKNTTLYVLAHNVAFDIIVLDLVNLFTEFDYDHKPPIKNGRQFIWSVRKGSFKLKFIDTANFGVMSVSMLGNIIRTDKGSVNFKTVDDDTLYEYCLNDTVILEKFIVEYVRFIYVNNLGSFKLTIASQAMTAYRTRFMEDNIFIHTHDRALKLERDAYHGGRTEAFYIGDLPVDTYYYVDVNSMYPNAMLGDNMPRMLRGYTEDVPLEYLPHRLSRFYCIADVTIETDEPFCCIVKDKKLIFPTGIFRTCLHHAELEFAMKHAKILSVHRCTVYERGTLFNKYVNFFYELKLRSALDNNKLWRFVAKLFLNSLYGKWGQRQSHREDLGVTEYEGYIRTTYTDITKRQNGAEIYWNNRIIREYKTGETTFSCPAIAGAITANARMSLYGYIRTCGVKNTYYTDTDSLIVNESGLRKISRFLSDENLGDIKIEKIGHYVTIHGAKDYEFQSMIRKKGVPMSAKEVKAGQWEYEQFLGWLTWLNGGMKTGMYTKSTLKQRQSLYDKGVIGDDGHVIPHHLE